MSILTDEAKNAIDKRVDEKMKDFKQAVYVLNTFKWLAGVLLATLGIGSYFGMNAWIEKKVNKRIQNYDEFMNAQQLMSTSDYEKSYELMKRAWIDLKNNGISSPSLSNMYFSDMITILANMTKYDRYSHTFIGAQHWSNLIQDNDFLDFLDNYSGDYYSRIDLSLCKVKFGDSALVQKELSLIEEMSNISDNAISSHSENEYFDRLWFPFIISVIKHNKIKAIEYRNKLISHEDYFFDELEIDNQINMDHYIIIYWANINNRVNFEDNLSFKSRLEEYLDLK